LIFKKLSYFFKEKISKKLEKLVYISISDVEKHQDIKYLIGIFRCIPGTAESSTFQKCERADKNEKFIEKKIDLHCNIFLSSS